MQDDGDAAFVVGDPGTVELVAVLPDGSLVSVPSG
jgi:hypothetical protein